MDAGLPLEAAKIRAANRFPPCAEPALQRSSRLLPFSSQAWIAFFTGRTSIVEGGRQCHDRESWRLR
eukprot:5485233-Lingulodinium_polyedra.AAC.1